VGSGQAVRGRLAVIDHYRTQPPAARRRPQRRATITASLGEERARELRARGADMDWDQLLAYTLTQTTQALGELKSATQP
jgi:hypothetical protein